MAELSPDRIDFTKARRLLCDGARAVFDLYTATYPGERFYSFELYTAFESTPPACPMANTLEHHATTLREAQADAGLCESLAADGVRDLDSFLMWDSRCRGYVNATALDAANALLAPPVSPFREDEDDAVRDDHVGRIFATLVLALADLDAEGYFGTGAGRDGTLLICSVARSGWSPWLQTESVRRLNPPGVAGRFWAGMSQAEWFVKEVREIEADPSRIVAAFHEMLAR